MSEQTGSWQPDPFGRHQYRYWDGAQWSDQVSNDGVVQTDPPTGDPAGVTEEPAAPVTEEPAAPVTEEPPVVEPVAADPEPAPATDEPAGWAASSEPDPTTAMPAASYPPPAPAAPGGPGGPTYPSQPPADSGDGGGRSKAPIIIIVVILLALAAGAAAYFLLMNDDDDEARGDLIAGLRSDVGLSQSDAECVVDELDVDLSDLAEAIRNDDDPTPAQQAAVERAFGECDVDDPADGDDTTSTTDDDTTSTTDDDTTSTTDDDDGSASGGLDLPPAMLALMAEQVATEMGITTDEAECLIEGIFSGLDEDGFDALLTDPEAMDFDSMSNMFEVFDDCGIDPTQLEDGGFDETGSGDSYGDDAALDALWDSCEGGDMAACDDLYFDAPLGSQYESFGDTCGGRQEEGTGNLCSTEFG